MNIYLEFMLADLSP